MHYKVESETFRRSIISFPSVMYNKLHPILFGINNGNPKATGAPTVINFTGGSVHFIT
jgi:hypothetical protein